MLIKAVGMANVMLELGMALLHKALLPAREPC